MFDDEDVAGRYGDWFVVVDWFRPFLGDVAH